MLNPSSGRNSVADAMRSRKRFVSYRLRGEYEKPWLHDPKFKRTKLNNYIIYGFMTLGIVAAGAVAYLQVRGSLPAEVSIGRIMVINIDTKTPYQMCMVYEDEFQSGSLDESKWNYEVALDGFGTGAFDWTTTDPKNVFVDGKGLHIVPTLTNETTSITTDQLYNGYTLNLTTDGTCTEASVRSCSVHSNSTLGSMIPPVRSARINTKGKVGLRYGRVEVEAKTPKGDWLWPAIWMMPKDSVYGDWPKSGEIDIMESRGNSVDYPGGRDVYYSTLHWGTNSNNDAYWKTQKVRTMRRGDFTDSVHTYGMEWDEKYIYTYFESRLTQVLYANFYAKDPLWNRGDFSSTSENNTLTTNPWEISNSTSGNAPFDQEFYLILNVAVGARNGWFADNKGGKPWLDDATNAQWTFWNDAETWLPTWGEGDGRGMTIKSVKMYSRGACGSTSEL